MALALRECEHLNLKIFKYGEPVLREKAEPVAVVTDALRKLAADMIDTMHRSKGVGLAAEQVGHTEKLCVIGRDFDVSAQFIHKLKDRAVAKLAEALRDYKD